MDPEADRCQAGRQPEKELSKELVAWSRVCEYEIVGPQAAQGNATLTE